MSTPTVLAEPSGREAAASHPSLQRLRFTPEMFHQLGALGFFEGDQRYELIEGDIYTIPPEGPEHAAGRTRLAYHFMGRISNDWHVRIEAPLRLGDSEPIPDLAIVPGRVEDYKTQHPSTALLVIEIAGSSLPKDRMLKSCLYAQAGIPEYWIVNLNERRLEVYREPAGNEYRSIRFYTLDETIAPPFEPEWQIPVHELFGGVE